MSEVNRPLMIEWVKRLRDPNSVQTRQKLRDTDGGMCCLGHLCHVVSPTSWRYRDIGDGEGPKWTFRGAAGVLPESVAKLAGLGSEGQLRSAFKGWDFDERHGYNIYSLVDANDTRKKSLTEIADAIVRTFGITDAELA